MVRCAQVIVVFFLAALLFACGGSDSKQNGQSNDEATRSFHMGLTPFPPDFSDDTALLSQIVDEVYNKLAINGDMVSHHFDNGIPWNDALNNTFPYTPHIMSDWQNRLDRTPANHKKYIAITPINPDRNGLALLRDANDDMDLTSPFDGHASTNDFNHNDVRTAYLNYCQRIIEFFDPDYLAIGIEVNLLRKNNNETAWQNYVAFNQYIYDALKLAHPDLAIFVSVSPMEAIETYVGPSTEFTGDAAGYAASQLSAINDVMTSSDYYAISLYPYMSNFFATPLPSDLFEQIFALHNKPMAFAETGMLAEDVTAFSVNFTSDVTKQADYTEQLLNASNNNDVVFINWFIQQDYDDLCAYFGQCTDTQKLWRDSGFYDGSGNARAALLRWQDYVARRKTQGP